MTLPPFQNQQLTQTAADQVLLQFDKAINISLSQRVRNKVNFKVPVIVLCYKAIFSVFKIQQKGHLPILKSPRWPLDTVHR